MKAKKAGEVEGDWTDVRGVFARSTKVVLLNSKGATTFKDLRTAR